MSSITKINELTRLVSAQLSADKAFKCSNSQSDRSVWVALCKSLSNKEVIDLVPVVLRNIWSDEETLALLQKRNARPLDRLGIKSLSINIVCARHQSSQSGMPLYLKEQFSQYSTQLSALSFSVYSAIERMVTLEEENQMLKKLLAENGIAYPHQPETKFHFNPDNEHDAITKNVL